MLVELLKAVKDKDWETMLKHFPEGVEHRTYKYTSPEDFNDWENYEDYSRYVSPAREMLIEKCLEKTLNLLK